MQTAVLNLALEQLDAANTKAVQLFGLAEQLGQQGLTMDLALEADRVAPSLRATELYFSAAAGKQQLALEGLLGTLWELIQRIFEAISNFFRGLFGQKKTVEVKAEEAEKKVAEAQASEKKVQEQAEKIKIGDLNHFVEHFLTSPEGQQSQLYHKLQHAPNLVREFIGSANGNHTYGTIMEEFLKNLKVVTLFLEHDVAQQTQEFKQLAEEFKRDGKISDATAEKVNKNLEAKKLTLTIHGHGQVDLHKAQEILQHYQQASKVGPVEFRALRQALHFTGRPKVNEVLPRAMALIEQVGHFDKLNDQLQATLKQLHKPEAKEAGDVGNNLQLAAVRESLVVLRFNLHGVGRIVQVFKEWVDMVYDSASFFDQVIQLVGQELDKTPHEVNKDQVTKDMSESAVHHPKASPANMVPENTDARIKLTPEQQDRVNRAMATSKG